MNDQEKDALLDTLNNPAELVSDTPDEAGGECCGHQLVFAMQDRYHRFSLPLETVLSCLRIAENEGGIPKLPGDWWAQVINRYLI